MPKRDLHPLIVVTGGKPSLTLYTFSKYGMTPDNTIRRLYKSQIKYLKSLPLPLSRSQQFDLDGVKHNIRYDPRYRFICYTNELEAEYAIEAAQNLETAGPSDFKEDGGYCSDWHRCYDFTDYILLDNPRVAKFVAEIVNRKRPVLTSPHYSDYHFLPDYKIELLPGDQVEEKTDLLSPNDRVIVVTRPVGDPVVAKRAARDAVAELAGYKGGKVSESLAAVIQALNRSYLVYLGHPEDAPRSGTMILMVYLYQNTLTLAQVGPITLKHKEAGRYHSITERHTFDNPDERATAKGANLPEFCYELSRSIGKPVHRYIYPGERDYLLYPNTPSRFIGHPEYCAIEEPTISPLLISTRPYIVTISY